MSEPVHNHINPAIANSIAAAWARRKEAFSRNRASGVPLTADNLQSAAAVDQHRILALQNSENNQQHWEGNMDYMQNSYAFTPQSHTQMYFQPVPYPSYVSHPQQQIEDYYNPYEYGDFFDSGMMHDEFGEVQEISTRPRLTKEQSEILEAHFQANHKPSAQVKRQLAIQTNLKLTRVGVSDCESTQWESSRLTFVYRTGSKIDAQRRNNRKDRRNMKLRMQPPRPNQTKNPLPVRQSEKRPRLRGLRRLQRRSPSGTSAQLPTRRRLPRARTAQRKLVGLLCSAPWDMQSLHKSSALLSPRPPCHLPNFLHKQPRCSSLSD